jgi:hypothetical protein
MGLSAGAGPAESETTLGGGRPERPAWQSALVQSTVTCWRMRLPTTTGLGAYCPAGWRATKPDVEVDEFDQRVPVSA